MCAGRVCADATKPQSALYNLYEPSYIYKPSTFLYIKRKFFDDRSLYSIYIECSVYIYLSESNAPRNWWERENVSSESGRVMTSDIDTGRSFLVKPPSIQSIHSFILLNVVLNAVVLDTGTHKFSTPALRKQRRLVKRPSPGQDLHTNFLFFDYFLVRVISSLYQSERRWKVMKILGWKVTQYLFNWIFPSVMELESDECINRDELNGYIKIYTAMSKSCTVLT